TSLTAPRCSRPPRTGPEKYARLRSRASRAISKRPIETTEPAMTRSRPAELFVIAALASALAGCATKPVSESKSEPAVSSSSRESSAQASNTDANRPLVYPAVTCGDETDDCKGVRVPAPYRWLEDPDAAATQTWIADERRLAEDWLAILPRRSEIQARIEQLQSAVETDVPAKEGGRYFFTRTEPSGARAFCVPDAL